MSAQIVCNLQLPSNHKFGWFIASVFAALTAYFHWKNWGIVAIAALIVSILFVAATLVAPQSLTQLNRLWYSFGLMLGKISSPIVLGFIFFALITPVSLITRLFGRDELKIKKSSVQSYWVNRSTQGPQSDSFKNQY